MFDNKIIYLVNKYLLQYANKSLHSHLLQAVHNCIQVLFFKSFIKW